MRRFPNLARYLMTFGSMTAALSVVGLIILDGGGDDPRGDGGNGVAVVVAEQDIAAGTEITEDMVKVIEVPEELVVAGIFSDTQPVVGQVTTVAFISGEQIVSSKVISPDDLPLDHARGYGGYPGQFGTVTLGPPSAGDGLTLKVEPLTTDGEPVLAGDHVDILVEREGGDSTVVENVEVSGVGEESITVEISPDQLQLLGEALISGGKIRLSRPA
jgi:pilus assembly protein CpaB